MRADLGLARAQDAGDAAVTKAEVLTVEVKIPADDKVFALLHNPPPNPSLPRPFLRRRCASVMGWAAHIGQYARECA